MSNGLRIFLTVLVCITILGSFYRISRTGIFIKQVDYTQLPAGALGKTINVEGVGKTFTAPDIATVSINVSELSVTTKQAQDLVNKKVQQIFALAEGLGIKKEDIQTSMMNIYPEYEYYPTGTSRIKGYRSNHTVMIKIRRNDEGFDALSKIIDGITSINGVQLQSTDFSLDDRSEAYKKAREAAYEKAKQKAEQLSDLAGVTLLKPLTITENVSYQPPMYQTNNVYMARESIDASVGPSSSIAPGQLEVNVTLHIIFGLE